MKQNSTVLKITSNAIVAVIYFCLTLISSPISFGSFQIRIAEALVLLCFFNKDYIIGVSAGCFLSNLLSPIGAIDILFGTVSTLLSCIGVSLFKHLLLSTLVPVLLNGFIIGLELYLFTDVSFPYLALVGLVALGEAIAVSLIGYLLFLMLRKNKKFLEIIRANKNQDFKW